MNVQELDTAFQHGIAPTYVVLDNSGYGLIAWKQETDHGATSGTELRHHDLAAVAEGFGARTVRIASADELLPAIEASFERDDVPTVIVVPVDDSENMRLSDRLGEVSSR